MTKSDLLCIGILWLVLLVIFYPLFYTNYLYTDEAVQLWHYKKGADFTMFLPQGRYLTEKLFQALFSRAITISDVKNLRLFSLFGWILSIPVWYIILKRVSEKEALPNMLPFFSVLYLISTPPFSVYVSWASCMELFIANTCGLLSGYFFYNQFKYSQNKISIQAKGILLAAIFGLVSLFTYQNGFGCFLLPFLLHFIAHPKNVRLLFTAIAIHLSIYAVYFLLFKYSLNSSGMAASARTGLYIAPWGKLAFLFTRPLNNAFHFTWICNEKDKAGFVLYALLFITWITATVYRFRTFSKVHAFRFVALVCLLFVIIYMPLLVVKENYASNRTLLAINMAVFILVAETILHFIKHENSRRMVVAFLCVLFIANSWYNFRQLFLKSITTEYVQLRSFVEKNYTPAIATVYLIRPHEDFFVKKYGITRSWDEFGVPSNFFEWVPEYFVKQVVFEKWHNHETAEKLVVKTWLGKEAF